MVEIDGIYILDYPDFIIRRKKVTEENQRLVRELGVIMQDFITEHDITFPFTENLS